MLERSEAACLLETGALYARRIGLRDADGALVFAGFKHGGFSIYRDDAPIFHFDLEARWQRAFIDGIHYLKALDGSIVAVDRPRQGPGMVLKRRRLSYAEGVDLDAFVRDACLSLIEEIGSGRLKPVEPPSPAKPIATFELLDFLDRIVSWDSAAWFAERERYLSTYGPLPFLPPDGQNALILQASLGRADGVSFGLGPVEEHRVLSPQEFLEHARKARSFLGRRLAQCRGVFLGGSDLLRRPAEEIEAILRVVATEFPIDPGSKGRRRVELKEDQPILSAISAFVDVFDEALPDASALQAFRELHLRRVFLGVESGDPEIRSLFGKSWNDEALRRFSADLKSAGIERSVLILDAAGGVENRQRHVERTVGSLARLDLDRGEAVYLLDPLEVGGESFVKALESRGLTPPVSAFDGLSAFKRAAASFGIKLVSYSLEKQGI